jgi:alkylhydroperoxidase family enzyme
LADALMTDYRTAPIESEFKELLCFTEKIARDAGQITPDDIARVRAAGFSDRAILDTAHVAGFFSYMNRVVQAVGADGKADIATPLKIKNWLDASSVAHM